MSEVVPGEKCWRYFARTSFMSRTIVRQDRARRRLCNYLGGSVPFISDKADRVVRRANAAVALVVLSMACMLAIALQDPLLALLQGRDVNGWREGPGNYYNTTSLTSNYLDIGFVRRALGGTIARLLSPYPFAGALRLHIVSAGVLIAAFGWIQYRLLCVRMNAFALFTVLFAVVSPQLFLGWSTDIGRTDMLVIGLTAWSSVAMRSRRPLLSAALLVVGYLAHESALIMGVPLVAAIAARELQKHAISAVELRRSAIAGLSGVLIIAALQAMLTPEAGGYAAAMLRRAPQPATAYLADLRDLAIYMTVSGQRGLRAAICYNLTWTSYLGFAVVALAVTVLNVVILGLENRIRWVTIAVFLPLLFLILVANDLGRWVKFACANAWLLSAYYQTSGEIGAGQRRLAADCLGLLALIGMGSSTDVRVNAISTWMYLLWGHQLQPVSEWMGRCDPGWRTVVLDAAERVPGAVD